MHLLQRDLLLMHLKHGLCREERALLRVLLWSLRLGFRRDDRAQTGLHAKAQASDDTSVRRAKLCKAVRKGVGSGEIPTHITAQAPLQNPNLKR